MGSSPLRPGRVSDKLKGDILLAVAKGELRAGDRIKSLQVLSREYSLSVNSIRQAIRELVDEKVLDVRGVSGTYVAASPAVKSKPVSGTVLVIYGYPPANKFDSGQFQLGVLETLSERGVKQVVLDCPGTQTERQHHERLRDMLRDGEIAGLIMRRHTPFFQRGMSELPMVFANNIRPPSFCVRCARAEYSMTEMTYLGTERLISGGHTRIGIISQPHAALAEPWPVPGYEVALAEHGIVADPKWIGECLRWNDRDALLENLARYFRRNEEITALCVTDDIGCALALDVLHQISPRRAAEMEVVSWANRGSSPRWRRPVIRIEIDHVKWGRASAALLLGLIDGTVATGTCHAVTPDLVEA